MVECGTRILKVQGLSLWPAFVLLDVYFSVPLLGIIRHVVRILAFHGLFLKQSTSWLLKFIDKSGRLKGIDWYTDWHGDLRGDGCDAWHVYWHVDGVGIGV